MQTSFGKFWISAVGIAVVTSAAGCGGNDAGDAAGVSSAAAPSPSNPAVDVDAAFTQVEKAVNPFWYSNAYSDIGDMATAGTIDTMKLRVDEYRGVMTTSDDDLKGIAVPPAAQPIVEKLYELNAAEIADLDALAWADETDTTQIDRLVGLVYDDDALVALQAHRLSAALGHSDPQVAEDQIHLWANDPKGMSKNTFDTQQYKVAHPLV